MLKLHIGCGTNILKGWLNCDFRPVNNSVLFIDAKKDLMFKNDSVDFIFTEHMIEHIEFTEAKKLISECYRILKVGGTIRISTPDFNFLLNVHKNQDYMNWTTRRFIKWAPFVSPIFVINNFVRCWGHKFIFDQESLVWILKNAGFKKIKKCKIFESKKKELENLENKTRIPVEFLTLETMTFEAEK